MPRKLTFEEVKKNIERACDCGTVLLSTTYEGNKKPLLFRCECGRTFTRNYDKFMHSSFRCGECKKEALSDKYKLPFDVVKQIIEENGCEYVSGEYKNNHSILTYRCRCGELFERRFAKFQQGRTDCLKCSSLRFKGENSHFYKDGNTNVYGVLRGSLLRWKKEVRELYENTCPITGEIGEDCDVHHITPFEAIFKSVSEKYGFEVTYQTKLSEIPDYRILEELKQYILSEHSLDCGILIAKKVHYSYHGKYKGSDCNEKNFAKFLKEQYNVDLEQIRKTHD